MNEHIEIEYKILISKNVFQQILNDYTIQEDYIQTNYYFTHPLLQQKRYMLRIREKKDQFEMTLKRPHAQHNIETNISLTKQDMEEILQHQPFSNQITDILKEENIPITQLQQEFSLTTHRYDIHLLEGILSLDENTYLDSCDYELEFEVYDEKKGYEAFLKIIDRYGLSYQQNCLSKIQRVYEKLKMNK